MALSKNNSLKALKLCGNCIQHDGAQALLRTTNIEMLSLKSNMLGGFNGDMFALNTSLMDLDLGYTYIPNEAIQH